MNLIWCVFTLTALWGVTWGISRLLNMAAARYFPHVDPLPAPILQLAALGCVSLCAFAVCAIGFPAVPTPPFIEALAPQPFLAAAFVGCGAVGVGFALRRAPPARLTLLRRESVAVAVIVAWLALFAWTLLPPFLTDEALYHLTFPLQHLLHGGFTVIGGHGNSSFPAFGEMLAFWPLACGSLSGARAIQMLVLALGVPALVVLLPEFAPRQVLWSCVCFILTPMVCCILPSSHIDVLQAIYEVTGILALHRYGRNAEAPYLLVGAWLVGCAAACKFLALALLPFAVLVILLQLRAWQDLGIRWPSWRLLTMAAFLMCLPVLPWLVRNAMVWGNPLFPFLIDFFPESARAITPEQRNTLDYFMQQFGPTSAEGQMFGWDALLHLPAALFFQARFDTLTFDGVIGPFALVVLLLGIVTRLRACRAPHSISVPAVLSWYVLFRMLVWLSTSWQMRFLISPYLAVCLAAPMLLMQLRAGWPRRAACVILAASLVWVAPSIIAKLPPLDMRMLGGASSQHALRLERRPESAPCDMLNTAARAGHTVPKVMLVWTQRLALWCAVDLYSESYDEAASFNTWLEAGIPTAVAALKQMGARYVLVDESSFFAMPPGGVGTVEGASLAKIFASYKAWRQSYTRQIAASHEVVLLETL